MKPTKKHISFITELIVIVILFIIAAYLVQQNLEAAKSLIGDSLWGPFVYIAILIVVTVVAPLSAVPLMPIASNIWGWLATGVLNVIGWTAGSMMIFWISRKYGKPVVRRLVSLKKVEKMERLVPEKNVFWSIVFLRIALPVDILSYALGMLSTVRSSTYLFATALGVAPFAFIFAYIGILPLFYQVIAIIISVFIILGVILMFRSKFREIYGKSK